MGWVGFPSRLGLYGDYLILHPFKGGYYTHLRDSFLSPSLERGPVPFPLLRGARAITHLKGGTRDHRGTFYQSRGTKFTSRLGEDIPPTPLGGLREPH